MRTKEWYARQKRLFKEAEKRVEKKLGKKKYSLSGVKIEKGERF